MSSRHRWAASSRCRDSADSTIATAGSQRERLFRHHSVDLLAHWVLYCDGGSGLWNELEVGPEGCFARLMVMGAQTEREALANLRKREQPLGSAGAEPANEGDGKPVFVPDARSLRVVRTREFWQQLVRELAEGTSVAAVARRHGISRSTFDLWRRKLKAEECATAAYAAEAAEEAHGPTHDAAIFAMTVRHGADHTKRYVNSLARLEANEEDRR
jgi:Transposase